MTYSGGVVTTSPYTDYIYTDIVYSNDLDFGTSSFYGTYVSAYDTYSTGGPIYSVYQSGSSLPIYTAKGCTCKASSVVSFQQGSDFGEPQFSHAGCGTGPFEAVTPAAGQNWCDTNELDCSDDQGWDYCTPPPSSSSTTTSAGVSSSSYSGFGFRESSSSSSSDSEPQPLLFFVRGAN